MLGLFVTNPWPSFYNKGMKTWEIRSYPTDYRGAIAIIDSKSNTVICQMCLKDCIPLNKERWEMNFEKHRTSCDYESLPYRKNGSPAYAWVLENPIKFKENITLYRKDRKPYMDIDAAIFDGKASTPISFVSERLACKFLGQTILIYWLKKNYFALVAISDLASGNTKLVTDEITDDEIEYVISQLNSQQ